VDEDDEALLLSSSVGFGVVGNNGAIWLPAARVLIMATKRNKMGQ
jgi:hypothetical protein